MKFGTTLRRLRKNLKLTLSDISRESGIQMATLSRIENNRMTGSLNNYAGLAKALGDLIIVKGHVHGLFLDFIHINMMGRDRLNPLGKHPLDELENK